MKARCGARCKEAIIEDLDKFSKLVGLVALLSTQEEPAFFIILQY
jgi:hypothetical protein